MGCLVAVKHYIISNLGRFVKTPLTRYNPTVYHRGNSEKILLPRNLTRPVSSDRASREDSSARVHRYRPSVSRDLLQAQDEIPSRQGTKEEKGSVEARPRRIYPHSRPRPRGATRKVQRETVPDKKKRADQQDSVSAETVSEDTKTCPQDIVEEKSATTPGDDEKTPV